MLESTAKAANRLRNSLQGTLPARVAAAFALVLLLLTALMAYPLWLGQQVKQQIWQINDQQIACEMAALRLQGTSAAFVSCVLSGNSTDNAVAMVRRQQFEQALRLSTDQLLEVIDREQNPAAVNLMLQMVVLARKVQATGHLQTETASAARLQADALQQVLQELEIATEQLLAIEENSIEAQKLKAGHTWQQILVICTIGTVLLAVAFFILFNSLYKSVARPLEQLLPHIQELSQGNLPQPPPLAGKAFVELKESLARLGYHLQGMVKFAGMATDKAAELQHYQVFNGQGAIGQAFEQLTGQLAKDGVQDSRRQWIANGITLFSEILRENNHDLKLLCNRLLSEIVRCVNAGQGHLYLLEEDPKAGEKLVLYASYAAGYLKNQQHEVAAHEGTLGEVLFEKRTILQEKVPENYLKIETGLGSARPASLLFVPLLLNGRVTGVFEIASLKTLQPYQIEFIEKTATSAASSILGIRSSNNTKKLLEQARVQTEMLQAQEEEMRQNMEELQATQEELGRQRQEASAFVDALNTGTLLLELNERGHVLRMNHRLLQVLKMPEGQLAGLKLKKLLPPEDAEAFDFENVKQQITQEGYLEQQLCLRDYTGQQTILGACFSPVLTSEGKIRKIICMLYSLPASHEAARQG